MTPRTAIQKGMWAAVVGAVAGCGGTETVFVDRVDTLIVERDRELFQEPLAGAGGFLGYAVNSTKFTACGNCHIDHQASWLQTTHASAWDGLQSSQNAQAFCEGCHTVNQRGNAEAADAGFLAVPDERFHDVQCESCHGQGLDHIESALNPPVTRPLASIAPGDDTTPLACAECHSGNHHPFADEWAQSAHATPVQTVIDRAVSNPASSGECLDCHTAQGALAAWGITSNYVERDDDVANHLGITCATCHDPHGSPHSAQLRFPIDVPSQSQNLCIKCHHKRAAPETDAATIRGPHSPEGPLLLGEGAGWFPDGFEPEIDRILSSHGTIANPRTCATCHVASFATTDAEGDPFNSTGHLFLAIPCLDATGIPTADQNCTVTERSFQGCTTSGCHIGGEGAARSAYTTAKNRIDGLVADVDALLALPEVAADFDRTDGIFTTADGAWFNARLGELPGSAVHNPFLIEQLLNATIDAVETKYGVSVP